MNGKDLAEQLDEIRSRIKENFSFPFFDHLAITIMVVQERYESCKKGGNLWQL